MDPQADDPESPIQEVIQVGDTLVVIVREQAPVLSTRARLALTAASLLGGLYDGPKVSYSDGCSDPPGARPVTPHDPVGRNDPCPCGSRKKYKRCCLGKPKA